MNVALPSDVLFIILDILGDDKDYNSLYQCALSSKGLAEHALSVLYRLYDTSPLRGGGTEDEQFRARRPAAALASIRGEQDPTIKKWITLWRSILLSTLDRTYLPYYSYIRYLDLDDLGDLLSSSKNIKDELFTPELVDFVSRDYVSEGNKRRRSSRTLPDNEWIKIKLGSAIVERNPSIRGMSCDVAPTTLNEWIEGSPSLQSLTVWSGAALSEHAGEKIRNNCPDFKQLRIYIWQNKAPNKAETDAEKLFNELQPNALEYFEVLSFSHLGPRSIKALGTQKNSLTELKLTSLEIGAIQELPSLGGLPALEVLTLTDSMSTSWSIEFYGIVHKVAEWMRSCKKLRRLELRNFVDDMTLLTQVLAGNDLHLSTLSFAGYRLGYTLSSFYEALSLHKSLEVLNLRGEGSFSLEDNAKLVQTISELHDLRELELKDVSDFFTMDNVLALTPFLPHLERLWISGEAFNDSVWSAFLCLPKIQSLAIYAFSNFTAEGVLDFISRLDEGNRGLNLSILNATSESNFSEEAQNLIREVLSSKLDGSFDFGLAQEEYSETDSENEAYD